MLDYEIGDQVEVIACRSGEVEIGEHGEVTSISEDRTEVTVRFLDEEITLLAREVKKLPGSVEKAAARIKSLSAMGWVTIAGALAAIVIMMYVLYTSVSQDNQQLSDLITIGSTITLVILFGLVIAVFTKQLNENDPRELRVTLAWMVRLTYTFGFTFLLLVLAPFLFMLPHLFEANASTTKAPPPSSSSGFVVQGGPFMVAKACTIEPSAAQAASALAELDCAKGSAQWVFSFGGVLDQQKSSGGDVKNVAAQPHVVRISGGLVVPVYFVFIALAGAVVGMLRRIPEIQRRAYEYIRLTDQGLAVTEDALPIGKTREHLVFQMVQVATAPFIALLVYATIQPESEVTTTAIAFAAGFSAEPFLLIIRDISDRLGGVSRTSPAD